MQQGKIKSFIVKNTGKTINDINFYLSNGKVALIDNNGHILLLKDLSLLNSIKDNDMPYDLIRKLESRGFINKQLNIKIDNEYVPEFFMVDMTSNCNMKCTYCLRNTDLIKNAGILKENLINICKYITNFADENSLTNISIQPWGGEPLLEIEKILLMRKLIKPKRTKVHISIETNGILLTSEVIRKLYDARIGIGISIDGNKESHDRQRINIEGKGTYDVVETHLLEAQKIYFGKIGTITTITKNNAPYIEEVLEYFVKDLHLTNVKFNFMHISQYTDCSYLSLSQDEIASTEIRLLNKLIELIEDGFYVREYNIFVKLKNLLFCQYTDICISRGCRGGRKMIVFGKDGTIFPCELTDDLRESIGSIYENKTLMQILANARKNRDFYVEKYDSDCFECPWKVYCNGGCTVRVISEGKRPPEIDNVECAINRALYPELIKLILEKPDVVNKIIGYNGLLRHDF